MLFFISGNTFAGVTAYILPAGIGTARHQIFQRQIKQNGGQTESVLSPGVTHVVVDDNMDVERALRLLKLHNVPARVYLVKCTWLSLCISEKKLLDVGGYTLLSPMRSVTWSDINEFVRNLTFLPNVKKYFCDELFCLFRDPEIQHEDISCKEPTAENTAEAASDKLDQVMQEKPTNVVWTNLFFKCN